VELLQAIYDGLERRLPFTPLCMLVFVTTYFLSFSTKSAQSSRFLERQFEKW